MGKIVEIKWSDPAFLEAAPDQDLGIDILGGEPGRLFAQVSDAEMEQLRQLGLEVNVLFDSVEAYVAAFGQSGDG